jgi:2-polyprenyl-3-methyl-5-hydroxy-6-metoxy-1,4-benzoquinol methylase
MNTSSTEDNADNIETPESRDTDSAGDYPVAPVRAACSICSSEKYRVLLPFLKRFEKAELVRCRGCGLSRFFFAADNQQKVAGKSVFWTTDVHFEAYVDEPALRGFVERYERYVPNLDLPADARILDVGCGLGTFMKYAEGKGYSLVGLEADPTAAKYAEENVKGPIVNKTIREYEYQPGEYDAIVMWDVIEHLTDPAEDVRHLAGALKPGGKLVIETPNEKYILRKVGLWMEKLTGYRLRVGKYFYYVEHKFYFNPENIARLLKDAGFSTVVAHQDKSIATREQAIFSADKFPLSGLVVKLIPITLKLSALLPNQNKMVVVATKSQ